MNSLTQLLDKYKDSDLAQFGGGDEPSTLTPDEQNKLKKELDEILQHNQKFFWVAVGMIVSLFVISVLVVLTNLDKPAIVQVMTVGLGISAAGLIRWMIKLWKDKTTLEILIKLAISLQGGAMKTVINVLCSTKINP